jgi:hypothetical protein
MGSGKDTVAALLMMVGYERAALADDLRNEVRLAVQYSMAPADAPQQIVDDIAAASAGEVFTKPTTPRMRRILQFWGEYRRAIDENYWLKKLDRTMGTRRNFAVSDVRYPNEAQFIRERGGIIWRIHKDGAINNGIKGHASEAVEHVPYDQWIDNNGSLEQLAKSVISTLKSSGAYSNSAAV